MPANLRGSCRIQRRRWEPNEVVKPLLQPSSSRHHRRGCHGNRCLLFSADRGVEGAPLCDCGRAHARGARTGIHAPARVAPPPQSTVGRRHRLRLCGNHVEVLHIGTPGAGLGIEIAHDQCVADKALALRQRPKACRGAGLRSRDRRQPSFEIRPGLPSSTLKSLIIRARSAASSRCPSRMVAMSSLPSCSRPNDVNRRRTGRA